MATATTAWGTTYYGDDPDGKSVGSNATASDGLGSLGALVSGGGLRDGNSINGGTRTMNGNGGGRSVVGSISSAAEDILAAEKIAAAATFKARRRRNKKTYPRSSVNSCAAFFLRVGPTMARISSTVREVTRRRFFPYWYGWDPPPMLVPGLTEGEVTERRPRQKHKQQSDSPLSAISRRGSAIEKRSAQQNGVGH